MNGCSYFFQSVLFLNFLEVREGRQGRKRDAQVPPLGAICVLKIAHDFALLNLRLNVRSCVFADPSGRNYKKNGMIRQK
jgi:hypothetical protein